MDASFIVFLGAGKCNVVVDLPMCFVPSSLSAASHPTGAAAQRAALRIRDTAVKECSECYRALEAYAGGRRVVPLPADLYAAIASVVPAKYHALMHNASEATLVPNFTSDPAQLLQMDMAASDAAGRVADYTVEVKPKSAWQPPQVVGIVADGVAHWIEEAKHRHCRYAQMLRYKEVRDVAEGAPGSVASAAPHDSVRSAKMGSGPYCPNYLFRPALSSREGLQRLMHNPQNNLKVVSYHASRKGTHTGDPKTLTVEELNGIADAIDASRVLAPLAHLQLYGCAPASADASPEEAQSRSVPVLDAHLLYHWSVAQNKENVQWIVVDTDPETLCSCMSITDGDACKRPSRASPRYVAPTLDYAKCLDRFYVSTTAKDVSLMIAVSCRKSQPVAPASECAVLTNILPEVGGGCFVRRGADVYRIGVVDLDSKTHKSLAHYYMHDKVIVNAFVARDSNMGNE
ncbi:Inositol-pentakisphosphate 2-kinase family protein [Leishmania donovani]|uniref:Inositol-pentakisphosphate 2-kinase n=1 Tax=Leishmania donovani TaxID=5661 RepID=A0A504XKV4_LEIDO|nr:Inositol-pentakisphosphate 2-kinase family protein [Leishmania donovani]